MLLNTHFTNCILIDIKWEDITETTKEQYRKSIKIINLRYQEYQYLINKYYSKTILNSGIAFVNMQKEQLILDEIIIENEEEKPFFIKNDFQTQSLFENTSFLMNGKGLLVNLSYPEKITPEEITPEKITPKETTENNELKN